MADEPKAKADGQSPDPAAISASASRPGAAPAVAVAPTTRIEGLAEIISEARHELHLLGHAGKFEWINRRLILLRNAVIALSVLVVAVTAASMMLREAYRETLSIAVFNVPAKLAERGITGQLVAQSLFDELIKRRVTVTTLNAGELRVAWTEHRSDVAVPDTGFTLKSVFRYLRTLTGKEIAIDGEMLVDGDEVTIKARLQGRPPRAVTGKLAAWESLMGDIAEQLYEVTQPVVLASYWGLTANSPKDIERLSDLILRMKFADPPTSSAAMSVANHAYGLALQKQNKTAEALTAWERARAYDPKFALPYFATIDANGLDDPATSEKLLKQTASLEVSKATRIRALNLRYLLARNIGDCATMESTLRERTRIAGDDPFVVERNTAFYKVMCEYQQAKGVAVIRNFALLHPENPGHWADVALAQWYRAATPTPTTLLEARKALETGIAADQRGRYSALQLMLALILSFQGDHQPAIEAYDAGMRIGKNNPQFARAVRVHMHFNKGEFKAAEAVIQGSFEDDKNVRPQDYRILGRTLDALDRTNEAINLLRTGYARFPYSCELYDRAGEILFRRGRDAEAYEEWERGIAAVPKCDRPYVTFARALIERKRFAEAKQKLEKLLKVSPESDGAEVAREMLAQLAKKG